jgi:hypothetical protein
MIHQKSAAARLAALAMCAAAVWTGGCNRGRMGSPADNGKALAGLEAGLTAWKRGDAPDALAKGSPAVYFNDREWRDGAKLTEYKVAGEPTPFGYAVQFTVSLTLKDAQGKTTTKTVNYIVNTDSATSVARADADS